MGIRRLMDGHQIHPQRLESVVTGFHQAQPLAAPFARGEVVVQSQQFCTFEPTLAVTLQELCGRMVRQRKSLRSSVEILDILETATQKANSLIQTAGACDSAREPSLQTSSPSVCNREKVAIPRMLIEQYDASQHRILPSACIKSSCPVSMSQASREAVTRRFAQVDHLLSLSTEDYGNARVRERQVPPQ